MYISLPLCALCVCTRKTTPIRATSRITINWAIIIQKIRFIYALKLILTKILLLQKRAYTRNIENWLDLENGRLNRGNESR